MLKSRNTPSSSSYIVLHEQSKSQASFFYETHISFSWQTSFSLSLRRYGLCSRTSVRTCQLSMGMNHRNCHCQGYFLWTKMEWFVWSPSMQTTHITWSQVHCWMACGGRLEQSNESDFYAYLMLLANPSITHCFKFRWIRTKGPPSLTLRKRAY